MIFQQLFEPLSSTYTYLIGCQQSGQALLVDSVVPTMDRDLAILKSLGLTLYCTVETHLHADHITAALHLREKTGCKIAFPGIDNLPCADLHISDRIPLVMGSVTLTPLYTPGHTDDHFCYQLPGRVLTGDCLLIEGCGRTDFQNGDALQLWNSITSILYQLDDDTLVYPGHDYQNRRVSTIAQEKLRNMRLPMGRSMEEFAQIMADLQLPYPTFIDFAVPGNKLCGECPADLPTNMERYCQEMTLSPQG